MTEARSGSDLTVLVLVAENVELRQQLAEAQELLVEMAVDAGDLQAEIECLRRQVAEAHADRDGWRTHAMRHAS